eukprot:1192345-Amorphochlora_amoeboformis.AAC.1
MNITCFDGVAVGDGTVDGIERCSVHFDEHLCGLGLGDVNLLHVELVPRTFIERGNDGGLHWRCLPGWDLLSCFGYDVSRVDIWSGGLAWVPFGTSDR